MRVEEREMKFKELLQSCYPAHNRLSQQLDKMADGKQTIIIDANFMTELENEIYESSKMALSLEDDITTSPYLVSYINFHLRQYEFYSRGNIPTDPNKVLGILGTIRNSLMYAINKKQDSDEG